MEARGVSYSGRGMASLERGVSFLVPGPFLRWAWPSDRERGVSYTRWVWPSGNWERRHWWKSGEGRGLTRKGRGFPGGRRAGHAGRTWPLPSRGRAGAAESAAAVRPRPWTRIRARAARASAPRRPPRGRPAPSRCPGGPGPGRDCGDPWVGTRRLGFGGSGIPGLLGPLPIPLPLLLLLLPLPFPGDRSGGRIPAAGEEAAPPGCCTLAPRSPQFYLELGTLGWRVLAGPIWATPQKSFLLTFRYS